MRALPNEVHPSWIEEGEREVIKHVAHCCHVYGTPLVMTCTYCSTGIVGLAIGHKAESWQRIGEQIKPIE